MSGSIVPEFGDLKAFAPTDRKTDCSYTRVLLWARSFCPIIKLLKEYKDSTCNLKLLNGEQRGEHLPKVFTFSASGVNLVKRTLYIQRMLEI